MIVIESRLINYSSALKTKSVVKMPLKVPFVAEVLTTIVTGEIIGAMVLLEVISHSSISFKLNSTVGTLLTFCISFYL